MNINPIIQELQSKTDEFLQVVASISTSELVLLILGQVFLKDILKSQKS